MIREREARRDAINGRLGSLADVAALPRLDQTALRAELRRRVADWRAPLARHDEQARQLLRKCLVGRLTVTPDTPVAGEERYAEITADGSLVKILSGIVFPKGMASRMPASWNHLVPWLRAIDQLRRSA